MRQLAALNPDVCYVDTHPRLDGDHDKFIDLIHLIQEGRQQMAETFYSGIEKILKEDLARLPSIGGPANH